MMTNDKRRALILARAVIQVGREHLICLALEDVAYHNPELRKACSELENYILCKLQGYSTLGFWQASRGIDSPTAGRIDRINWISWMLGELT